MCQIIPFPQKHIRPYRTTPIITYSLDEYSNNPPIEYQRFTIWNSVYLNYRERKVSVLFPAYMVNCCKRFFSEAKLLFEKGYSPDILDPGKYIYNAISQTLHGLTAIEKYAVANNSTGIFSSLNNRVDVDVLVSLYVSDNGVLKIGFRHSFYRWVSAAAEPVEPPFELA